MWMNLEDVMLSDTSQAQKDKLGFCLDEMSSRGKQNRGYQGLGVNGVLACNADRVCVWEEEE